MTEIVQIRVDEELKTTASNLFESLGLDLSTAIRMFLIQCVNRNGIPFEIKGEDPSSVGKRALLKASQIAEERGTAELSLDQINEIIAEVRFETKERKRKEKERENSKK